MSDALHRVEQLQSELKSRDAAVTDLSLANNSLGEAGACEVIAAVCARTAGGKLLRLDARCR